MTGTDSVDLEAAERETIARAIATALEFPEYKPVPASGYRAADAVIAALRATFPTDARTYAEGVEDALAIAKADDGYQTVGGSKYGGNMAYGPSVARRIEAAIRALLTLPPLRTTLPCV